LKNGSSLIFGFLGIMILVVVASGYDNSTPLTFSDGVINFNYPNDFENSNSPMDITSEITNLKAIAYMADSNNIAITLGKNPQATSAAEARDTTIVRVNKISTGKVLSKTTETNPNGVVVEKSISNLQDPTTNKVIRHVNMFFKSNGVVYGITVYGNDSKNQQITETADTIFNSLK
jgi:hypothetical protein